MFEDKPAPGRVNGLLGAYPIDLSEELGRIESGTYGPFDEAGLPLVDYNQWYGKHGIHGEGQNFPTVYTPVTVAQFGLAHHQEFLAGGAEKNRRLFLTAARWMAENLKKGDDAFWVWEHLFPMPIYGLNPPWASAMAQGEGVSLLLRAYELTKNQAFLRAARQAFQAFLFPVEQGGVTFFDSEGNVWFEEYPVTPPPHVLNGMIFAMIGLYEFWRLTGDVDGHRLFVSGALTLSKFLPKFDAGYGSRYDLKTRRVVEEKYHRIHVAQLRLLFDWTGEEIFRKMADRWESTWTNPAAKLKRAILPRLSPAWISRQARRAFKKSSFVC